jgi:hypothetical protein
MLWSRLQGRIYDDPGSVYPVTGTDLWHRINVDAKVAR